MSDVQFNEDQAEEFGRPPARSGGDLTGKLIKWGFVSTRQEAEYVMIGIGIAVAVLAFFVYLSTG